MSSSALATLLGLGMGLGLLLVWMACWESPPRAPRHRPRIDAIREELARAGLPHLRISTVLGVSIGLSCLVFVIVIVTIGAWPIAACLALASAVVPVWLIRRRSLARQSELRALWPEAIDHLSSGIRAGLSLPEAVMQLADRGPEGLRGHFEYFRHSFQSSGSFISAMRDLKAHCADPIADRVAEALILTRHVGGSDVGSTLRTLAEFVRAENRVRSELLARQQWTVAGARLAVAAPWIVLLMLAARPENAQAYSTPVGASVLLAGLLCSTGAYAAMRRIGRLPIEPRVLR